MGELEQVVDPPPDVMFGVGRGALEERRLEARDEGTARAGLPGCIEHLVELDVDREIATPGAARAAGVAVENEEVGLADPVGLVVDREAAPGDDSGPLGHGMHGLPLPGLGILDLDDPGTRNAGTQPRTHLLLVVVTGLEQLLEERRRREWLAGSQHVELDPLWTGLGEGGVSRRDLDGHHECILASGRDTRRDAPEFRRSGSRRSRNAWHDDPVGPRCGRCTMIPTAQRPRSRATAYGPLHRDRGSDMERSDGEPDTDAFRAELRAWLSDHLTPEVVEAGEHHLEGGSLEVLRAWNRTLADGGWAAPSWPVEHGGRGAGVDEQLAYLEETNRVARPGPDKRDRRLQHRTGHHAIRHPRTAGEVPPAHAAR